MMTRFILWDIAVFLMASILRKVPAKKVIVLAGLFYLLRLSLTAVAPNYIVMLLVQMFQGLSFAVIWPASMAYLNQIMDYEVRSTAIMTFSSVLIAFSNRRTALSISFIKNGSWSMLRVGLKKAWASSAVSTPRCKSKFAIT